MATAPANQLTQLDATLQALEGGLPRITPEAKDAVGGWITTLHGTPALAAVADELRKLQDGITQGHHGTITDSLSKLSELTAAAAVTATPDVQSKLYQLSSTLKMTAGTVGS